MPKKSKQKNSSSLGGAPRRRRRRPRLGRRLPGPLGRPRRPEAPPAHAGSRLWPILPRGRGPPNARAAAGYQQVGDFAAVDAWRAQRTGFPEVVWAPGKSAEQIAAILRQLASNDRLALASRCDAAAFEGVARALGDEDARRLTYNAKARLLSLSSAAGRKQPRLPGTVVVLSAGTADEAVAEECRAVADAMGCYAFRLADVSVDGLHRVLHNLPAVRAADVVVVVSGTDGALPAVVAGLVEAPVIAVPTSVG